MRQMVRIILYLVLAIIYFLVPYDLIPDKFGELGHLDDFIVLFIIIGWFFFKPLIDELRAKSSNEHNHVNNETKPETSTNKVKTAYEILQIDEDATKNQIKLAYRKLIKKYHPDLVNQMGDEIQELAKIKTKEINEAYEYLMSL